MARGNSDIGTTPGKSECMVGISNARAVPDKNNMANIASRPSHPCAVPMARPSAASAFPAWQTPAITRRSNRSSTCPATSDITISGKNCTSPTRPRSRGSLVRS